MFEIIKLMFSDLMALSIFGIVLIFVGGMMLVPVGLIGVLIAALCGCFRTKPTERMEKDNE